MLLRQLSNLRTYFNKSVKVLGIWFLAIELLGVRENVGHGEFYGIKAGGGDGFEFGWEIMFRFVTYTAGRIACWDSFAFVCWRHDEADT